MAREGRVGSDRSVWSAVTTWDYTCVTLPSGGYTRVHDWVRSQVRCLIKGKLVRN